MKIISGGQTGVDQAALGAALHCGLEIGGWCPFGKTSESGETFEFQAIPRTLNWLDWMVEVPAAVKS
jgi:hypothetical protein